MASLMGVAPRTYGNYERGERVPDAEALVPLCREGWNINWLLTGEGPERLSETPESTPPSDSQPLRREDLKLAVQLAEEALDGGELEPQDYAELVALIHDALVNGLPSAQVLAFARPAARGLIQENRGNDRSDVGGPGTEASRRR